MRLSHWKTASILLSNLILLPFLIGFGASPNKPTAQSTTQEPSKDERSGSIEKIVKTEDEWKRILSPEQFYICRKKGTEQAYTGKYWNNHEKGVYLCAACGLELFDSDTKFESGTGWPSFWEPLYESHVQTRADRSYGMTRVEAVCARCGSHLGHIFDDGPKPTGLRYCINSASLDFRKK